MEAATLAARHARWHAAFRTDLIQDTVASMWHPIVHEGVHDPRLLAGAWAASLAFGDQIDQIDRVIEEAAAL